MKSIVLAAITTMSPFLFAMDKLQTADIGFNGVGQYIAIEITTEDGQDAYKFWLRDSRNNRVVEVSQCIYLQKTLDIEVTRIVDPSVKADFDWIFFKSGHSSVLIEKFFQEFRELLKRSRSECEVKSLKELRNALAQKNG